MSEIKARNKKDMYRKREDDKYHKNKNSFYFRIKFVSMN